MRRFRRLITRGLTREQERRLKRRKERPFGHADSAFSLSILSIVLVLSLASMQSRAVVLEFEGPPPGALSGPIIEGDFRITAASVEPSGPNCPTPGAAPCPATSNGQYLATNTGTLITLERVDGEPFDLDSFSYHALLPIGSVAVYAIDEDGNSVGGELFQPGVSPAMTMASLDSRFDAVVFASFDYSFGALPLSIDSISIPDPPPDPPDPVVGTLGTMVLLSDDRRIDAAGRICVANPLGPEECGPVENESETPSPDFALFDAGVGAGVGGANQNSTVTTGELEGSGSASGAADLSGDTSTNGAGNSFYDVQFQLLAPSRIQIEGTLMNFDISGGGIGGTATTFELTRGSSEIYSAVMFTGEPDVVLGFDEVVPPGIYRVVAHADGYIWTQSGFDFLLAASPTNMVPGLSPATIAALLTGLLSLGVFALRRSTAS